MVIRDPKTRHEEVYERNSCWGYSAGIKQTDCLIRLLKARSKSHVIGFFVGEVKDVINRADYFWKEECLDKGSAYSFKEKLKETLYVHWEMLLHGLLLLLFFISVMNLNGILTIENYLKQVILVYNTMQTLLKCLHNIV